DAHRAPRPRRPGRDRARRRRRGPRLRRPRRASGRPRARARRHLPRGPRRADEAARGVRARRSRAVGRGAGVHPLLRAGHRGAGARLDEPGRRDGRAHGRREADHGVRHRRAARPLAAAPRDRRGAGHDGAHRTRGRLGPAGHAHGGPPRRRLLRGRRRQDLDHQRPPLGAGGAAVPDRPGGRPAAPRRVDPAGGEGARVHRLEGSAQAGVQGRRELRAGLRRRARARGRPARRRGGPRLRADDDRAGDRPRPGGGPGHGGGAGRVRRRPALRPGARELRATDLAAPVGGQPARRHGHAAHRGPPAAPARGPPRRERAAQRPGGRHGQAVLLRGRDGDRAVGHPRARRLRLLDRVRRRALLPRRPPDDRGGGHQRDPARRHRPAARGARPAGV
ncbi:MAG: Acyl-CoA dehydrogenase, partial [uncultured Pseudonocardia sp.]